MNIATVMACEFMVTLNIISKTIGWIKFNFFKLYDRNSGEFLMLSLR